MTYYMYFIQTFIIRCTDAEILAEIDHKVPNWTFLTLKMTYCYYLIISIIMGKSARPEISDLENDLLNNLVKSTS